MSPRTRLPLALAALLLLAPLLATSGGAPAAAAPDGMLFGAHVQPRNGETRQQAVERMEAAAGRQLDVVREFLVWNDSFPNSYHTWMRDTGRTMILSVRSRRTNGTLVPWADIAAAQPGSTLHNEIVRWADRIRDFGVPVYFTFNHEPESSASNGMGEAPDYIAAWRKVHGVFAERGADNATFMWIMTDYSHWVGSQARNHAPDWYPGDAYLEAMGIDAYNWHNCRTGISNPWKSLEAIIKPFRDFGAQHPDEDLWLAEWASTEDPAQAGRKGAWFAEAQALFKRSDYAQFVGISYFNYQGGSNCPWPVDTSPTSLAGFRTMAQDAFYGGPTEEPPPPPPDDVEFVAAATSNANRATHSVTIPSAVTAGDTMLLFFTGNSTTVTTTPPAGWTQVRGADVSGLRGRLWMRTATAGDAGSTVSVPNSSYTKADLKLVAYRGTGATPLDVHAIATESVTRTQHVAPSVTPTQPDGRVLAYWADKSSSNTDHTVPAALTELVPTTRGSGSGYITASIADMETGAAGVPTGTFTAVGTASASRAVMYTVVLRP